MMRAFPGWLRSTGLLLFSATIGLWAPAAIAAGFSVLITPPRFELRAQPGNVSRQVLEITNTASSSAKLSIQTAEWAFAEDGSVLFSNPLADDSCRPWTALEARSLELGPSAKRRFRFEVAVPPDAVAQECRFAILFEGEPELIGQMALPVSGRLAIIVYVAVGDAQAQLELRAATSVDHDGMQLPALIVSNTGSATTRLDGFLGGRDGAGREIVFMPQNAPVLPGQTRTLVLYPQSPEGQAPPAVELPIRLSGRLDWSGRRLDVDEVFGGE